MARILSAEDILGVDDKRIKEVEVPEWGGSIFIRTFAGFERDLFTKSILDKKTGNPTELGNFRAKTLALGICDQGGNRIFTNSQIEALGKKNSAVIERLFMEINKLNGLTPEEVVEITENFETGGQTADSNFA